MTMKKPKSSYKEDLAIDPDALDVEWLDQPSRFMRWSRKAAHAEDVLRRAEEKLKVLKSELILRAMKKGLRGEKKPTGQAVEAFYRTQSEYIAAKEEWLKASYDADMLRNAVSAFHQRRYALQDLVQLHGQNYFAGPMEPRNLSKESRRKKVREEVHSKIGNGLNQRGRDE